VAADLKFNIPTDREALVAMFLSVPEGPQRILLGAMKLGSEQSGRKEAAKLLDILRTDYRTREIVARVEKIDDARIQKIKAKQKAERRYKRLQIPRK